MAPAPRDSSFRAQRGICFFFSVAALCVALSAHAQMRGGMGGRGSSGGGAGTPPGRFHGGVILRNRGFFSRPFHHQFSRPFVSSDVAVPMWWDEPEVIETEAPLPQPQPIVVDVDRNEDRDPTPAPVAQPPLIIEREGDRYVRRAAGDGTLVSPVTKESTPRRAAVVVLQSGEQIELTDYAITSDALYNLHGGSAKKIEISDVNLPATNAANVARGVDFTLPGAR